MSQSFCEKIGAVAVFGSVLSALIGGGSHAVQAAQRSHQSALDPATIQREWDRLPETPTAAFLIRTNLPKHSKAILMERADDLLDQTEKVLRKILDLSPRGPYKFRLSVFATAEEYRAYVSAIMTPSLRESYVDHSGGFFSSARNEIVVSCQQEECPSTLVHEFTHALADRTSFMAGGERVSWSYLMPPWLNEGLAEYVTAQVEKGWSPPWDQLRVALKEGTLIPLTELIDKQSRPLEHPLFYPAAWSLTTLLISQDRSGSPAQVKRYLQLLKTKRFATDQFETIFWQPQNVEQAWKRFIKSQGNV